MSRTKRFFYNALSTAVLQFVMMIAGFIVPRFILQYYGSEINGLIMSINQFISYFSLVEAGLAGATVYALYKPLADNDFSGISAIIVAAKKFYALSGYIFVLLTLGLALIYPIFIKSSSVDSVHIGLLVVIISFSSIVNFFVLGKYQVLLTADQKIYVLAIATIVATLLSTSIIAVLATTQTDIVLVRFVALLSIFSQSLILWSYVKINYRYIDYSVAPNNAALNKRWDALFLQILGIIQAGAPIVIITLFTSLITVSVYSIFAMVLAGLNGILSIFARGLSSAFGDVLARKEVAILQKSYQEFELAYYIIITAVYGSALFLIMPFVRLYTIGITDANYDLPIIGFLFVVDGLLYNIKTPQGMMIQAAGLFRETRWQTATQALIIVIGGVIFIQIWGIAGVIGASIMANTYRNIDLIFYVPRTLTNIPVTKTLTKLGTMLLSLLAICFVTSFLSANPHNFLEFIYYVVEVIVISTMIVILTNFVFHRSIFLSICERFCLLLKVVK